MSKYTQEQLDAVWSEIDAISNEFDTWEHIASALLDARAEIASRQRVIDALKGMKNAAESHRDTFAAQLKECQAERDEAHKHREEWAEIANKTGMTLREVRTQLAEAQEQLRDMEVRFSELLDYATGGRMSKTNYDMSVMRMGVDDEQNREYERRLAEEKEPMADEITDLRAQLAEAQEQLAKVKSWGALTFTDAGIPIRHIAVDAYDKLLAILGVLDRDKPVLKLQHLVGTNIVVGIPYSKPSEEKPRTREVTRECYWTPNGCWFIAEGYEGKTIAPNAVRATVTFHVPVEEPAAYVEPANNGKQEWVLQLTGEEELRNLIVNSGQARALRDALNELELNDGTEDAIKVP